MGGRNSRGWRGGFTMLELVGAVSILALLLGCFQVTLQGLYRMQRVFETETLAVVLVDNLVERLAAQGAVGLEQVSNVFQDEWRQSPLLRDPDVRATCQQEGRGVSVRIAGKGGVLAEVTFSP